MQESGPEDLAVKRLLLQRLDASAAADAVIGSSTSSFRLVDMVGDIFVDSTTCSLDEMRLIKVSTFRCVMWLVLNE